MLPIWRIKDIILFNGCYKPTRMFRKVSVGWTSRNKPELMYCSGKWSPFSIILERVSLNAATTMSDSETHHPCRYAGTLQPLEPSRFLAGSTLLHHGHLASSALYSPCFVVFAWEVERQANTTPQPCSLHNDGSLFYQFVFQTSISAFHCQNLILVLSPCARVLFRKCHFELSSLCHIGQFTPSSLEWTSLTIVITIHPGSGYWTTVPFVDTPYMKKNLKARERGISHQKGRAYPLFLSIDSAQIMASGSFCLCLSVYVSACLPSPPHTHCR